MSSVALAEEDLSAILFAYMISDPFPFRAWPMNPILFYLYLAAAVDAKVMRFFAEDF